MLNHIRNLIKRGDYVVKLHTRKRMIERKIKIGEVKEAIANGEIIEEHLDDKPLPSYLIYGRTLKDRPIHVVVGVDEDVIAIITVYEPEPEKWIGYKRRR
ncbi:MAG: DUF4258 domain-containing protein [Methanocellales archaeon]|nr:DUF4258 domain-containing protein [Methanocellales archaeon]MDI6903505.1 DUF4258 domain-containing protein [Methanocellales archaeon]